MKPKRRLSDAVASKKISAINASKDPTAVEYQLQAELEIVKLTQRDAFGEEVNTLSLQRGRSDKATLPRSSALHKLSPFLDGNGVMRVGGRIVHSSEPFDIKHPIILPRKHHVTTMVIGHFHSKCCHQGRGITINTIRSNGVWIVGCTSAVSQYIYRCVTCRKLRSKTEVQKMSDLPEDRLEVAAPFTYTAVDIFGPWVIKERRSELKRWGALFTCMAMRGIHIEVVNSMDTDSFINALRRFLAIRGPMRQLRSDRGTNFVGAKNEMDKAVSEMDHGKIHQYLLQEGCEYMRIEFKMNVPSASHMGGVWERQIRTVRSVLGTVLSQAGSQLDDESLRTFMYETMAIVNSRPLTVQNLCDPQSPLPLTPNQLLTMKSNVLLPPPGCFQGADLYSRKRWRRVQYLANQFWQRWKCEFLQSLQTRSKWNKTEENVQLGDIVIIKEENLP